MGGPKQAPYGYQCPYRDACPHLNGRSAIWSNYLIDDISEDTYRDSHYVGRVTEENAALRADNLRLEKENAELRARSKALHASRFKPNRHPPRDPAGRRKRGAPKGHPPWNRPSPQHVERIVQVPAPTVCPHCSTCGLQATGQTQEQIQEDIILQPKTIVTAYRHDTAFCPSCRRPVFQTAEEELRNCQIGPTAKATAVYLRHEIRLSYRNVNKILSQLFGLSFVPTSAMNFDQKVARSAEPIHEQLRDKVRCADIIHGDETHWRIDGKGAYIWFAGNPNFGFFHIDRSRSSQVALDIFGPRFQGNLVADAYAAYNAIEAINRQSCLAHLIRKAREISQLISLLPQAQQLPADLRFCDQVQSFFSDACHIGQLRDTRKISFSNAQAKIPELYSGLHRICKTPCQHPEAENLRQRLLDPKREYHRLFTFLKINRMPPTNNYAEQTLRHPVIFRKLIFGNRSDMGADTLAINLSLIHTAKCRHREIIPLLKTILLSGHKPASDFLFNNSS
jgi:transposase